YRMDYVIYEEFKGTGNMELHLDRNLANRRIFPAIDILHSGTRKEDLLVSQEQLDIMWKIRNHMQDSQEFIERFMKKIRQTKSNEEFIGVVSEETKKIGRASCRERVESREIMVVLKKKNENKECNETEGQVSGK